MKDKDEIIKAAHKHALKGQIDEAIAEYLKILPYSQDGNIQNIIGDLYLKKNSTDEAVKYFREAAVIFNKDESHAKAIALYNKVLSINPDLQEVVIELAELNAERGFIKQAVEGLTSAAEAYYEKGLPMKAMGIYKKTLEVCPSDTALKIRIADIHLETSHTDRAIKMYLAIATEYEANAESAKAENIFKKVISLDPGNIESLTHLSRLAEDNQDLELAFDYISKAAAIAPHNNEIMFEYSNLAKKTNKDISECLEQIQDEPYHKDPQQINIPDDLNNVSKTDTTHGHVDLSSKKSLTRDTFSAKPISTSATSLPLTSTGIGSEESGFTVHSDTGETEVEKKGIWDDIHNEDKNNFPVIDSIQDKTSKAVSDHETAEAEYDQNPEKYKFNLSVKEPAHEKKEKDSRRLKKRQKNNRSRVSVILFFVIVTSLAFSITFKFIKDYQTVDVETPKHVIHQEPKAITDTTTNESSSLTSNTSAQDTAKEKVQTKTKTIKKEDNIKAPDEEVMNLPVSETVPSVKDNQKDSDITQDIPLTKEDIHLPDIEKQSTDSAYTPDSESLLVKENEAVEKETLTVPKTAEKLMQEEENNKEVSSIIAFDEPFDNNNNSWDIIETSAAYVRMMDGQYYIRNRRESGSYIILNGPDISTGFEYEVETHIRSVKTSANYSYGLVFGAKDKEDFFAFQLLPEDTYSIKKYYKGVSLELAGGPISMKLNPRNQFNVLTVKNESNKISFYINDNFIDDISDISFSNRKTGFFVDGKTEIAIDKIFIHQQPLSINSDLPEVTALVP